MIRRTSVMLALCAAVGCSGSAAEPEAQAPPAETTSGVASPETFAGAWRSVTPSLEFVRLTVHSLSSEQGALGARLTLSGVAWEGRGRIRGDSLAVTMTIAGTTAPSGVLVVRSADARTLRVQMRPTDSAPLDLTFVREH